MTLNVSPSLLASVAAVAEEADRPLADVVREALERYVTQARAQPFGRPQAADGARTPGEAADRMRARRTGNRLPDGLTIRDLLTFGRV